MGKKILIADDDNIIREIMKDILEDLGYETEDILFAKDGQEAIEIIITYRDIIGLVITDYHMPRANGDRVVKTARERGIECILMTDDKKAADEMVKSKIVFLYMEKPFNYDDIQSAVSQLSPLLPR